MTLATGSACFGGRNPLFHGQLATLPFTLRVTDRTTGEVNSYAPGPSECGAIDSTALRSGGVPSLAAPTPGAFVEVARERVAAATSSSRVDDVAASADVSCLADGESLLLLVGQFRVRLGWRNPDSETNGRGQARAISDLAGSFSFDNPRHVEVLVKTLDFGDHVLVLFGSLSDFEHALDVTELATGRIKTGRNPAGTDCGGLDERFRAAGERQPISVLPGVSIAPPRIRRRIPSQRLGAPRARADLSHRRPPPRDPGLAWPKPMAVVRAW